MRNDYATRIDFRHAMVANLYSTPFHTLPECFEELLALPREELINDLEKLLRHEIKFMTDNDPENDEVADAVIHSLRLLGHLKSEKSLPLILEVFRMPTTQSDIWLGDLPTEDLWDIPVLCGMNQLEALVQLIKDVSLEDKYSKSILTETIEQVAYFNPEKQPDVIRHLTHLLHFFNALSDKAFAKHLGAEFVVASIADAAANLSITEILLVVEELFGKGRIDPILRGDWIEYQKEFGDTYNSRRVVYDDARDWYYNRGEMWENIQQRNKEDQLKYEKKKLKKEQAAAQEALRRAKQENLFQVTGGKKIGRNEPCPCGSGKKFKKCHGA